MPQNANVYEYASQPDARANDLQVVQTRKLLAQVSGELERADFQLQYFKLPDGRRTLLLQTTPQPQEFHAPIRHTGGGEQAAAAPLEPAPAAAAVETAARES